MIGFKTYIQFYHTAAWNTCDDVLQDPPPTWEYGLPGSGVMDLVADTGMLSFSVDNSEANTSGLPGYYTIGHANCPAWFVDGLPVRVRCERQDDMTITTRFTGFMVSSRPSTGMYLEGSCEIDCRDWMDYAGTQKIGLLEIQSGAGLGVDDVLTAALVNFALQPAATDFDVGRESFPAIFNTDDAVSMTMMALFQKYARNEAGHIFLEGDGTLRFDNRHARPLAFDDDFTLDASGSTPMTELDVQWTRDRVVNEVRTTIYPVAADTGAGTILWTLQDTFAVNPGQVIEFDMPFRDPDTGKAISATDVVDPLVSGTHIKASFSALGTDNLATASLTYPITVGGNSAHVVITNTHASATAYVHTLQILGNGLYTYEPLIRTQEDAASIAAYGRRPLTVQLEQITSVITQKLMGDYLLGQLQTPARIVNSVRFLANFDTNFATAALTLEPNMRFRLVETQAAVDDSFYACRLRYEAQGPLLWVEVIPATASAALNYFIWDEADHGWDEGVWIF